MNMGHTFMTSIKGEKFSDSLTPFLHLTGEEKFPLDQSRIILQANLTYFPPGKVFEKQTGTIEDQGEK